MTRDNYKSIRLSKNALFFIEPFASAHFDDNVSAAISYVVTDYFRIKETGVVNIFDTTSRNIKDKLLPNLTQTTTQAPEPLPKNNEEFVQDLDSGELFGDSEEEV